MRRREGERASRPQAQTAVSGGSSGTTQQGLGVGLHPAWASGEGGSQARPGGFPFAGAARADWTMQGSATAHSVLTAQLQVTRQRIIGLRPESSTTQPDLQSRDGTQLLDSLMLSRDFQRSGRSTSYRSYQGNWAVPARAGRRRTSNFCLLA